MRFGQRVILYKDGVPYEYRITFKGWLVAILLRIEELLHITIIPEDESK